MASKGLTFFSIGTLFGGLLSAAVVMALPDKSSGPAKGANVVKVVTKPGKTKVVRVQMPCKIDSKPSVFSSLAQSVAMANDEASKSHDSENSDMEAIDDSEMSDEDIEEFVAAEKELYQEQLNHIDSMREDLVNKAGLNEKERLAFQTIVEDVSKRIGETEKNIENLLGPLPPINEGNEDDWEAMMNQPAPPANRKAMLENELAMTQALLDAQTRFESLVGKERMKELGPQFHSVEAFIKVEPLNLPEQEPVKGAQELIR